MLSLNSPSLLKHKKLDDEIPLTSKIAMVGGGVPFNSVPPLIVQIVHKSPTPQAINVLKSRQMPLSSRGFRGPGVVSMGIYMLIHAVYNVLWEAFLVWKYYPYLHMLALSGSTLGVLN